MSEALLRCLMVGGDSEGYPEAGSCLGVYLPQPWEGKPLPVTGATAALGCVV